MKEIFLTRGKIALVDDADYDFLMQWKWFATSQNYVARGKRSNGKQSVILMHRVILNTPEGFVTDHINGKGLDNQRHNIKVCSQSENMQNSSKYNKTGYKGVHQSLKKFCAYIWVRGRKIHLGTFDTAIEAAKVYDAKAKKMLSEHAQLNF